MLGMDVTILDETGSKELDTGITTQPGENVKALLKL
jgi:hypothetical protein